MAPTASPKKSSSGASTGLKRVKGENFYRDAKKAARVKMLSGGKPVRDKDGKIIQAAAFQKGEKDVKPGRVQPDRRWFGNTRVISQTALEHFRNSLSNKKDDPYSVLLKRNKLPMSLLDDSSVGQKRPHIVETEPFSDTFGPKAQRKKPRLEVGSFEELVHAGNAAIDDQEMKDAKNEAAEAQASESATTADVPVTSNKAKSSAPALRSSATALANTSDYTPIPEPIFTKGTSRRIYGELYKVLDSSDVIIHVLDARDPLGTLCSSVIEWVRKEKAHKQVVYLINKVDLVPAWVTQRYVSYLTPQAPTLAFHASQTHSFGKGSLIQLLRQFSQLHSDRKQISVGFVGYPNVGKSSVINCLKAGRVCKTAPIPGETKVWQYITLMRRIYLIDCPGIVPASSNDGQTSKVLKGVVRVENLASPSEHIPPLLERVRPIYLERTYGLEGQLDNALKLTASMDDSIDGPPREDQPKRWTADAFLDALARKSGKLLKGGEADRETVAKMVLNDWIRGKIPYFVRPPDSDSYLTKNKADGDVVVLPRTKGITTRNEAADSMNVDEEVTGNEWSGIEEITKADEDEPMDSPDPEVPRPMVQEPRKLKSILKKPKEPRKLYVQQNMRGIITGPKFLGDDNGGDVGNAESAEEEDEGEWLDEESEAGSASANESEDEEPELLWDDVISAVPEAAKLRDEAPTTSTSVPKSSNGKQRASMSLDGPFDDEDLPHIKGPRMTTNKRKASNFFTTANVKNKNREKAMPKPGSHERRGAGGNKKGGGKGGKKR
ncbi:GTPase required for pre-60S ribosomal subunit nuclear export and maturation [Tulasnella sp. 419]|nr:GTPase required for pre-60S ribosomal subunit nuclear export and maturation [Tulasnella sp. 419]